MHCKAFLALCDNGRAVNNPPRTVRYSTRIIQIDHDPIRQHLRRNLAERLLKTTLRSCWQHNHNKRPTNGASRFLSETARRKMLSYLVGFLALTTSAVLASPTPQAERRHLPCTVGSGDTVTAGNYELLLDQWGISGASGSQCAHVTSMSGSTIAWTTNWTRTGGSGVKDLHGHAAQRGDRQAA